MLHTPASSFLDKIAVVNLCIRDAATTVLSRFLCYSVRSSFCAGGLLRRFSFPVVVAVVQVEPLTSHAAHGRIGSFLRMHDATKEQDNVKHGRQRLVEWHVFLEI